MSQSKFNTKLFIAPIIILSLVIVAILQNKQPVYTQIEGFTQGTTYHITYEGKQSFKKKVDSVLHDFDLSLSTYIPNSIISRINENDTNTLVDEYFTEVFNEAKEISKKTDGFFDITVAPLVNAYGFGPGEKRELTEIQIDSILSFVGIDLVTIEHGKVIKQDPNVQLDVNAIAQGYSVDVIAAFLEKQGVVNYLVEIGGEIKAKGKNPDGVSWRIGIDKPIDNNFESGANLQEIVMLENLSLATSGNYRKFYEKDGVKYTHSINPKTGLPVSQNILSATVFAKDCIIADAYATACMVGGLEKAIEFLNKYDFLDGYLIYSNDSGDYEIFITPRVREWIIKD